MQVVESLFKECGAAFALGAQERPEVEAVSQALLWKACCICSLIPLAQPLRTEGLHATLQRTPSSAECG